jgi:hypothetical protein
MSISKRELRNLNDTGHRQLPKKIALNRSPVLKTVSMGLHSRATNLSHTIEAGSRGKALPPAGKRIENGFHIMVG